MKKSDFELEKLEYNKETLLGTLFVIVIYLSVALPVSYNFMPSAVSYFLEYLYNAQAFASDSYRYMTSSGSSSTRDYYVMAYENGLKELSNVTVILLMIPGLITAALIALVPLGQVAKFKHVKSVLAKHGYHSTAKTLYYTITTLKIRAGMLLLIALLMGFHALHIKYKIDIRPDIGDGIFLDESMYLKAQNFTAKYSMEGHLMLSESGDPLWVSYKTHKINPRQIWNNQVTNEKELLAISVYDVQQQQMFIETQTLPMDKKGLFSLPSEDDYTSYILHGFMYTLDNKLTSIWRTDLKNSETQRINFEEYMALYDQKLSYKQLNDSHIIMKNQKVSFRILLNNGQEFWLNTESHTLSDYDHLREEDLSRAEAVRNERDNVPFNFRITHTSGEIKRIEFYPRKNWKNRVQRKQDYLDLKIINYNKDGLFLHAFDHLGENSKSYLQMLNWDGSLKWEIRDIHLINPELNRAGARRSRYHHHIVDDRLLIEGYVSGEKSGFYMIDRNIGKVLWKFQVPVAE
ncbi:hypothetical protein [Bacterioplanoides sp.]|uniref:hypothetical protein n=1 Tax=Bacterioplanoides sp. TaxID=2066072 RepID=UPI003AFF93AF